MAKRNIVVIGTSAGGVETLARLLAGLSVTTGAALFVVADKEAVRTIRRWIETSRGESTR